MKNTTREIAKEMFTMGFTFAKTIWNSCIIALVVLTIQKKWKPFCYLDLTATLKEKVQKGVLAVVVQPLEEERWYFLL